MSIDDIISRKEVSSFLERNNWQPVEVFTHGSTSEILIIEKSNERYALKLSREKAKEIVLREHRLLVYLNTTESVSSVPRVGEWLEDINGFLMEYLLSPSPEVRESENWPVELARALRLIHRTKLHEMDGIPDDRPDIAREISRRLSDRCSIIYNGGDYWKNLPREYVPALEKVRKLYDTYFTLMPDVEKALIYDQPALTHGDLAGDNIMVRANGTPVFADWGEVRISSGVLDIACLLTYVDWSEEKIECFLAEYYGHESLKKALPDIRALLQVYRYFTCVSALWWLIQPEEERLDTVGRAFFDKLLVKL